MLKTSMDAFSLRLEDRDAVVIVRVQGYLGVAAGKELQARIHEQLKKGKLRFVLDFAECRVVSSPGVVSLLELATRVTDDFRAQLAISGLDELKSNVFWMAGVSNVEPIFPKESEAVSHLLEDA